MNSVSTGEEPIHEEVIAVITAVIAAIISDENWRLRAVRPVDREIQSGLKNWAMFGRHNNMLKRSMHRRSW